jgi:Fe2+ transport system protein FeoA
MEKKLNEVSEGFWEVSRLDHAHPLYFRMLSLGFSKSAKVQLLGSSHQIKIRLRQSIMLLRKEEASAIWVKPVTHTTQVESKTQLDA